MPDDIWMTAAKAEWVLWQKLCTRLVLMRVVTKADLESVATGPADTTGKRLLNLMREWGDARGTLALANAAYKESGGGRPAKPAAPSEKKTPQR